MHVPRSRQRLSDNHRCVASIPPVAITLSLVFLSGCWPTPPAAFKVNLEGRDRSKLSKTDVEAIRENMEELFGAPNEPKLPEGVDLDLDLIARAAGRVRADEDGRQWGLYRQHCAVCHGISGDGAGPNATQWDPYPCDFRLGWFKYTSTRDGGKPTRADLRRTLVEGVPDTAMPSFSTLPDREIDELVEYVMYLSLRGEVERAVAQLILDEGEYLPLDPDLVREEAIEPFVDRWNEADSLVVDEKESLKAAPPIETTEELAASIERGRRLYVENDSQCIKCHGPNGDGDGEEKELYDDRNKPKKGVSDAETLALAKRFTLPLQRLRARNFHQGVFRGGDRPIDLYWRIHVGIKGTPMPSSGPDSSTKGVFTPAEIWDVVNYVLSLSGK
jgi:mono/diheme cytochrome c family protein